ncbi:MAG: metal ABC transporter substrate-binding protein [Thermodesulfobacteriota bacterium]
MKTQKTTPFGMGLFLCSVLCALAPLFGTPPGAKAEDPGSDLLTIYVVNYPLKYFAERIAQGHAKVVFPAPADEDPAFWTPGLETIAAYQKADLILLNGAGYARWVEKASLPRSRVLDTSAEIKNKYIRVTGAVTHSHGAGGEHAHEGYAFTTWIDFDLAVKQAGAIGNALGQMKPGLLDEFQSNYAMLARDLKDIDKSIREIVSKNPSQPLIGSHPVYQYFCRRYDLNMKSVHWEPDEIPSGEQWEELKGILANHPARWMIWEGDPVEASVKKLESMGVRSLTFEPCGNEPDRGDFLSVMRQNVENLKAAFPEKETLKPQEEKE